VVRITLRKAGLVRKTALASALTIVGWLFAHTLNAYVSHALLLIPNIGAPTPEALASTAEPPSDSVQMAQVILSSGLFMVPPNASALNPDADESQAPPPPPPIEVVGKLKLLGTAIREGGRSSAAIENLQDHKQSLYFLQDTIEGYGLLAVITRDGVTIKQGNRQGYLPLAEESAKPVPISIAMPSAPKRPNTPTLLDRRQLQQNLSDVSKLLTEARAMPYYNLTNNGKLEGWQLIEIKPNSILDQLGIQQRDVMLRINGIPVVDPGTMLRLLQEIQHERLVKVDLIRGTDRQTFTYEIR
jgi:general secretion pathway protein C